MTSNNSFLRVSGTDVVDGDGKQVILKGVSEQQLQSFNKIIANLNSVLQAVT